MTNFNEIMEKFGLEPDSNVNFNILITCLKVILQFSKEKKLRSLQHFDAPLLQFIENLNDNEIVFIEKEIFRNKRTIEECQILVQINIAQKERKKLAAYYTTDEGIKLMASLSDEYIKKVDRNDIIIADPFLGAARTLTATVKTIKIENVKKIWGIEPYPLAALVGYAALLKATNGRKHIIEVKVGDTFNELSKNILFKTNSNYLKADIIITNPPFTRWEYLDEKYRKKLFKITSSLGYSKYITRKQTSLQILCMFLVDYILKRNGLLISVLPASTFYTIYGRGYKELIKQKYQLLSFLASGSQPAFSIDSGFKEVIIVGLKKSNLNKPTVFAQINGINIQDFAYQIFNDYFDNLANKNEFYLVNINELAQFFDNNWLSLIGNKNLKELILDLFSQGIKNGILGYWKEILGMDTLIRGIEMYGPDFFFLRNKYWDISDDTNNHIEIENKNTKEHLIIKKSYLIKALRKPSLYNYSINPDVDTYMVSIPPKEIESFPDDLRSYIIWGKKEKTAIPAVRKYKQFWYSHVYYQVQSKEPFGNIFITDKVDLNFINRGIFANFSEKKLAASKNFYIIKNIKPRYSILLTAWFNSTVFISILILFSRKISDTWTRFLINDYLEVPILNITTISDSLYEEISKNLFKILYEKLPPFWEQIGEKYRYSLDISIAKAIGIKMPENFINNLYNYLKDYLKDLTNKGK